MADSIFKNFFNKSNNEEIASSIHHHVCIDCGCHDDPGILKPALKHTINIFIFLFITNLPVSYTHLDVYKRQVYVICLFITGAITKEDLELIPKGEKLKKFVRK